MTDDPQHGRLHPEGAPGQIETHWRHILGDHGWEQLVARQRNLEHTRQEHLDLWLRRQRIKTALLALALVWLTIATLTIPALTVWWLTS